MACASGAGVADHVDETRGDQVGGTARAHRGGQRQHPCDQHDGRPVHCRERLVDREHAQHHDEARRDHRCRSRRHEPEHEHDDERCQDDGRLGGTETEGNRLAADEVGRVDRADPAAR